MGGQTDAVGLAALPPRSVRALPKGGLFLYASGMERFIRFARTHQVVMARWAIAIVYLWFGTLKLIGASPAEPLVEDLFDRTLGWLMPFAFFYGAFSLYEVLIGGLILARRFDRVSAWLIGLHLVTTVMPLLFLPETSWSGFLVPTLVGQYIIKNVLIVAAVVTVIGSHETTKEGSVTR